MSDDYSLWPPKKVNIKIMFRRFQESSKMSTRRISSFFFSFRSPLLIPKKKPKGEVNISVNNSWKSSFLYDKYCHVEAGEKHDQFINCRLSLQVSQVDFETSAIADFSLYNWIVWQKMARHRATKTTKRHEMNENSSLPRILFSCLKMWCAFAGDFLLIQVEEESLQHTIQSHPPTRSLRNAFLLVLFSSSSSSRCTLCTIKVLLHHLSPSSLFAFRVRVEVFEWRVSEMEEK